MGKKITMEQNYQEGNVISQRWHSFLVLFASSDNSFESEEFKT